MLGDDSVDENVAFKQFVIAVQSYTAANLLYCVRRFSSAMYTVSQKKTHQL